jgi:hypothetical protein
MNQYKIVRYIVFAIIGFVILGTGFVLIKLLPDADGILKTLPYICIGLGSGLLGGNLGTAIKNYGAFKNPQIQSKLKLRRKMSAVVQSAIGQKQKLMTSCYTPIPQYCWLLH